MRQRESLIYWDRVASEKRFSHPLCEDWLQKRLGRAARILDYGCGYGRTLGELSRAGYSNIIGMDFSSAMLALTRNQFTRINLIQNDGSNVPIKNESVDAVLLFAVLTCLPKDEDQRALIAEVSRVLCDGGLIYISDLLINEDARNRERYESDIGIYGTYGVFGLPEGVVVRHHHKEWIEELTSAFKPLEFQTFSATTMNGNKSAAFQYLGSRYQR